MPAVAPAVGASGRTGLGAAALASRLEWNMAVAQDSAAADVTGEFNWKRDDGKTIKALLNVHPYADALKADLQTFTDLTGIKVQYDLNFRERTTSTN